MMKQFELTYSFDILQRLNEAANSGDKSAKKELENLFAEINNAYQRGDLVARNTIWKCFQYNICRDKISITDFEKSLLIDNSSEEDSIERAVEYLYGYNNTEIDVQKGFAILNKNASNPRAQFFLGICYIKGLGCNADPQKAYDCFVKSATNGNPQGQNWLGNCYWDGIGTEPDKAKAFEWIKYAAENYDVQAILNLGFCYDKGIEGIIGIDKQKAKDLYWEAAWQGNSVAAKNFETVRSELQQTNEQYESAKKMLKRYKPDVKSAFAVFEQCAKTNYPPALYELGVSYYEQKEYETALNYLILSQERGFSKSGYYLGMIYENGFVENKDIEKAIEYYSIAAEGGDEDAKKRYQALNMTAEASYLYAKEFLWYKQYDKCVEYIQNSKFVDDSYHQHLMALCYLNGGYGVKLDREKAFHLFKKAAAQGNPKSMNCLSMFYLNGDEGFVKRDINKALALLTKAMSMDYPAAYGQMAELLLHGKQYGVEPNVKKALEYAHKAAQMGFHIANKTIADCYQNGIGVEKDIDLANEYYRKSLVESVNPEAEYKLVANGQMVFSQLDIIAQGYDFDKIKFYKEIRDKEGVFYYAQACLSGYRTKRDYNEGIKYLKMAIEMGHPTAPAILGICYDLGIGVKKDQNIAIELFRKSADAGDCQGLFNLATYYLDGICVEKDTEKAKELYQKCFSINPDFVAAKDAIESIEKKTISINKKQIMNTFYMAA